MNQFIRTLGGRIRPLPNIRSSNAGERAKAERQAVNTTIQGSAADLMKEAMLSACSELNQQGVAARLICQLHDEVLFEVREEHVRTCATIVRQRLETISVAGRELPPMPVSLQCGKSWGQMSEM